MMDPVAFDLMLSGDLGSLVRWARSHRCPCLDEGGGASQDCLVCLGKGVFWDSPAPAYRCGVLGLSERDVARMQRRLGDSFVGDAQISIPPSAPFWGQVKPYDRILVVDAIDTVEWVITKQSPVRLPVGATIVTAYTLTSGRVVQAALPAPDANGRIIVAKPYT
ncbi:MAG TPA: hypothetical protein VN436_02520, partial [Holophaga sp.]|nr:hypothetical protein [Holophaga sp.]